MFKPGAGPPKGRKSFWGASKWNLMYIVLALLLLFSLLAVPKIAVGVMSETKGQIITIPTE